MIGSSHHPIFRVVLCVALTACAPQGGGRGGVPASNVNLYDLPHTAPATGHAAPTDNDSYYTQPNSYQGCSYINDAPSCGGG